MTTIEILLLILTVFLGIFFALLIALVIVALKLVGTVKKTVTKAELAIESVEAAASSIKDARGPIGAFKMIQKIYDLNNRRKK